MIAALSARLAAMVAVILVLVAAVLALQRVVPGDPARLMVGVTARAEIVNSVPPVDGKRLRRTHSRARTENGRLARWRYGGRTMRPGGCCIGMSAIAPP